jgi:hypothetical protein
MKKQVEISCRERHLCLLHYVQTECGGPPSFPLNSLGTKRPGREADHSPPSGADLTFVPLRVFCGVMLN